MKVKICPLCDAKMTKAHYCDSCHSFIWKPEEMDIHYNAHGGKSCAYGSEHDRVHHSGKKMDAQGMPLPKAWERRTADAGERNKDRTSRETSREYREVYGGREKKRRQEETEKKHNILVRVIAFVVIVNIVLGLIPGIIGFISSSHFLDDAQITIDKLDDNNKETTSNISSGYTQMTHEEVMNGGRACNGYAHMKLTAADVIGEAEQWFTEQGYSNFQKYETEDNYAYTSSYSGSTDSYYQITTNYSLYDDKSTYTGMYMIFNADTYTGKLHQISASAKDDELAQQMLAALLVMTDTADTAERAESICEECFTFEDEEYTFTYLDNIEVYVSKNGDNGYYITVSAE